MAPEPEFWVLDAVAMPHAAEPTLSFRMRVRESSERDVYTIALKAQIQLEASERPHGEESRERLRDVFGEPERWNDTARGVLWTCRDVLVPSFTRLHEVRAPGALLDRPRAGHDPLLRRGARRPRAARLPLQRLGDLRRRPATGCRWRACRGTSSAQYRLPVEVWRTAAGDGGLVRVGGDTFAELRDYATERGLLSERRRGGGPAGGGAGGGPVSPALDELVDSLLYEGYALYPYTPGATKNATPTPFGIVYPPAYAERNPSCFERLRIQCVLEGDGDVSGEVRFLQPSGERHEAPGAPDRARRSRASWSSTTRRCAGACACGPSRATTAAGS